MNRDQNNDHWLKELLAQDAGAVDGVEPVGPTPEALENARLAVRVELNMTWLRSAASDPAPSAQCLERLRQAVHEEMGQPQLVMAKSGRSSTVRRVRFWIPSSIAACLVVGVGSLFWIPRSSDRPSESGTIMAATLDNEFQSDWFQLANLEASVDEVERDLRGFSGALPRRGVSDDFDRKIDELSDELAGLEDMNES